MSHENSFSRLIKEPIIEFFEQDVDNVQKNMVTVRMVFKSYSQRHAVCLKWPIADLPDSDSLPDVTCIKNHGITRGLVKLVTRQILTIYRKPLAMVGRLKRFQDA